MKFDEDYIRMEFYSAVEDLIPEEILSGLTYGPLTCKPRFLLFCEGEKKDEIDGELAIFQDLQRLQADFVNYRTRVERDRGVERQLAVVETIRAFLPALDDLTRAEAHGDVAWVVPVERVLDDTIMPNGIIV